MLKIEDWMMKEYGMERVFGVPQLFVKREATRIELLIAKATDEFLVSGKTEDARNFMRELGKAFKVGKVAIGGTFRFISCEVDVGDDVLKMSLRDFLDRIKKVKIADERRHQGESLATDKEEADFRSVAGVLMYLGNAIIPQAAMMESKVKQKLAF